MTTKKACVVVGVGLGNGAALGRRFVKEGYAVSLFARTTETSGSLAASLADARDYRCDATDARNVPKFGRTFGVKSARRIHARSVGHHGRPRAEQGMDAMETLADVMLSHGILEHIRSDNGPEMTAKIVRDGLQRVGANTLFIEGQPLGERLLRMVQRQAAR